MIHIAVHFDVNRATVFLCLATVFFYSEDLIAQQRVDRPEVFRMKDLSEDGSLDKKEFAAGALGKMREASDQQFDERDLDGDGKLSIKEFEERRGKDPSERREQHRLLFANQDRDENGNVTLQEFTVGLSGTELTYETNLFRALDKDGDDVLNEDEFTDREAALDTPQIQFQNLDKDLNQIVTLKEFTAARSNEDWVNTRTELFQKHDKNGDEELTVSEFATYGVQRARQKAISQLPKEKRRFAKLDTDQDGKISKQEYLEPVIESKMEQERLIFLAKDKDRDRHLTASELSLVPRDDIQLRFVWLDNNVDGKLTIEEFVGPQKGKPAEKNLRRSFEGFDADADGALSLDELTQVDAEAVNRKRIQSLPPDERAFARLDVNDDKRISMKEFLTSNPAESEQKRKQLFRAFDASGDNHLDLNEYLSRDSETPAIVFARRDQSGDGRLDEEEFIGNARSAEVRQSRSENFKQHDQNQDGILTAEEFSGALRSELAGNRSRWLAGVAASPMNWLTLVIVLFDLVLVAWIGRAMYRRWFGETQVKTGTSE
tara:strand:- start:187863 stop:189500 length:1638 start_codon:yes stop_codon:yes gene_type:complete